MISELVTFWITKAKAKVKFGVKSLCEHECKVSSVPMNINAKAKATKYSRGINFTLISVATVSICRQCVGALKQRVGRKNAFKHNRIQRNAQKAADVWKKDVWDFQVLSQTFLELQFSQGKEGKDGKNLNSQIPDLAWNSQTSFSQTSTSTRNAGTACVSEC